MTYPVVEYAYGSYDYLMREVGALLGYGRNTDTWSHEQRGVADAVVQRGVRAFYTPVPLPGEKSAHEWSFLRPVKQLTTVASTYKYDLPPDFAMLDGPITYKPDQTVFYQTIDVVSELVIRERQVDTSTTGRPTLAAIIPSALPRRYEIHFWVTPDAAYVLEFPCQVNPQDLSAENQYPYGGVEHSQTILESCLAVAEEEKAVRGGPHSGQYMQRLAASVSHDRKLMCPRSIGRNTDRADYSYRLDRREIDQDVTLYQSQEWD